MESKQGNENLDVELKTQNEYAVFYYSYNAVINSDFISNAPLEHGANFADMFSIDSFNANSGTDYQLQNSSECFINSKLQENLDFKDDNFYIKFKDEIF